MSTKVFIKTGILNPNKFLYNSFVCAEMNLSILMDENLQGRKKVIFAVFSMMKFFEHNIIYCELINWAHDLNRVNNVIFTNEIFWLILTDPKTQHGILKNGGKSTVLLC